MLQPTPFRIVVVLVATLLLGLLNDCTCDKGPSPLGRPCKTDKDCGWAYCVYDLCHSTPLSDASVEKQTQPEPLLPDYKQPADPIQERIAERSPEPAPEWAIEWPSDPVQERIAERSPEPAPEPLACLPGEIRPCYPQNMVGCTEVAGTYACQGACKTGTQSCAAGTWSSCSGAVTPVTEQCDGQDNDCNGSVDEGCPICTSEKINTFLRLFTGHTKGINRVDFSPDGSILASASADTSIRLWGCP